MWPDSFSNNKYVIMIGGVGVEVCVCVGGGGVGGGGGLHVEMAGRVVEWFWVARSA